VPPNHPLPAPAHSHPASATIRHAQVRPQARTFLSMTPPSLVLPGSRNRQTSIRTVAEVARLQAAGAGRPNSDQFGYVSFQAGSDASFDPLIREHRDKAIEARTLSGACWRPWSAAHNSPAASGRPLRLTLPRAPIRLVSRQSRRAPVECQQSVAFLAAAARLKRWICGTCSRWLPRRPTIGYGGASSWSLGLPCTELSVRVR
jgi:hypothetical protein